ncbi:MAG: two-component system, NtrC family, response regulator AlgB [Myxococcales bacterium]|jgi:NtrC-family two-component system response regulator AlgB|nr:two-component system, NtrC family, response regulator AlgB [Myxococcales bacterium]
MPHHSVLIVDDEKNIRQTLKVCLESMDAEVIEAATAPAALEAIGRTVFDIVFLDLRIGSQNGLDLIPQLLAENPNVVIIVVTAYATLETAVDAIRRGAWDYLPKPFTPAQIRHLLEKADVQRLLSVRMSDLQERLQAEAPDTDLDSAAAAMRSVLETVSRASKADVSVLFRGESGTGKGVLARAMHLESNRRDRPFVTINCPTLTEELLASELFGHAKGAFTGAVRDQPGRVEVAEGGTLFLDEIGDLPASLQAKLLRFLQERRFERVGETRTRKADVRVVAATNRDLEADVRSGRFREDLFFRLNVIEVRVPSLRERPEDVLHLAKRFLAFFARSQGRPVANLSPASEKMLMNYAWPGNVRELRNAIERAVILWPSPILEPQAFPERISGTRDRGPHIGGKFTLDDLERAHISAVVAQSKTMEEAAVVLGIDDSTLWRKRKKYEDQDRDPQRQ